MLHVSAAGSVPILDDSARTTVSAVADLCCNVSVMLGNFLFRLIRIACGFNLARESYVESKVLRSVLETVAVLANFCLYLVLLIIIIISPKSLHVCSI